MSETETRDAAEPKTLADLNALWASLPNERRAALFVMAQRDEARAEAARLRGVVEAVQAAVEREIRHMTSVPYPLREDREAVAADLRAAVDAALEVVSGQAVPIGPGDDDDVASARCCPTCRHDLTAHNRKVWEAGHSVGQRHERENHALAPVSSSGEALVDVGRAIKADNDEVNRRDFAAFVGSSGEAESGEAKGRAVDTCGTCYRSGWYGSREGSEHRHCPCGAPCNVYPCPLAPAPVPSGGQADGEGVRLRPDEIERLDFNYQVGDGRWLFTEVEGIIAARLAARPVLSREALHRALYNASGDVSMRHEVRRDMVRQQVDAVLDVLTAGGEQP